MALAGMLSVPTRPEARPDRRAAHLGEPSLATLLRFSTSSWWEVAGMAGPGDEMLTGAVGQHRLRASHADREQVIAALKYGSCRS
jgi:hypothetical protein